ncbi:MAG: DUF488 family protein [Acidimicrobiia bacterium]|nr:DUF488 family protein [Acidimicrobiia bacterium]
MSGRIWMRRAYEPPSRVDGTRVLIDRLWPRGVSRDDLMIDAWLRDVAPSDDLRRWFGHDIDRWEEFRRRYRKELTAVPAAEALEELRGMVAGGRVTLVFAAKDSEHCNVTVLAERLSELLEATG